MDNVAFSDRPANATLCRRRHVVDLASRLSRTMAVARGLIRGGRQLDITGIDDGVGILCAQTLDLTPEEASGMLPVLRGLLTEVDLLAAALRTGGTSPRDAC